MTPERFRERANGFFWVTTPHPHAPHIVEIRNRRATLAWEALPGERHHSTTGEPGDVWRNRGLAPQALVGVGFTGQGMDAGAPYRRSEESYDKKWAYWFDGIEGDVFGDTPSLVLGHGVANFELDRIDPALGSPSVLSPPLHSVVAVLVFWVKLIRR